MARSEKQSVVYIRMEYAVPIETGKSAEAFATADKIATGDGLEGAIILSTTTPEARKIKINNKVIP
jgi:hypothetical protein